jgi:phosphoserine phosphatase
MTPHALVLTAAPDTDVLTASLVGRIEGCLAAVPVLEERWLSPGEAWDATFAAEPGVAERILTAARRRLAGEPVDVNVVAGDIAGRRKLLLVADMDSTIIAQECIDEMADVLGLKPRIAAITERAMRGELDFEAALAERLRLLAGITEDQLAAVYRDRVRLTPGARTLVATMRSAGAFTALVSGGFTFFTSRVAAAAGFHESHANTLDVRAGRLTGSVVGPILGREAKRATLLRLSAERGIAPEQTLAVGDGANDLDMIRSAGLGVAFRAKPVVATEAAAAITHGDLTALLYLQGFTRAEFVVS